MDVSDITPQLDQLEEQLNKAQEVLGPLLGDIGDISGKLPLLDKAKLYVLVSYTIESLLFCKTFPRPSFQQLLTPDAAALRLNGVETKNHAIFTELTRVKQYMDKIQKLENPPAQRENAVNTEVAARFFEIRPCRALPSLLMHRPSTHMKTGRQQRHKGKVNGAHCQGAGKGGGQGR